MNQAVKRGLALLMALIMCLGLLPATQIFADAAEVEYVYASNGKYIYNWGTRGETATYLSPNAEAFYTDGNTYELLSAYVGGTSTSDAPNSELYAALKTLMAGKHSNQTSYNGTRDLYQYTDCQNSAKDSTSISSFYSGLAIGPEWDSGSTWNREHTWPNSKGDLAGNGENDIMMLRPTASSENGARGNTAYGESAGYYDPNSVSGGTYNLHGDVARIILYVYVRWGCTNTGADYNPNDIIGTAGVIESLDVLLKWMEEDPVDTWELGRNDSVQSITGTRNVFVDYPELAFLLFGADMPTDMSTPSGEAKNTVNCEHNYVAGTPVDPTCTAKGYTTYTCSLCGRSYQSDYVDMVAHNYVNGVCEGCGKVEPALPVNGDKVVIWAPGYNKALSTTKTGNYNVGVDVTLTNGTLTGYGDTEVFTVIVNDDGTYSFAYNGQNLGMAASYSSMNLDATNDKWELTDLGDGLYLIKNTGRGNYMEWYEKYSNWSTYNSASAATDPQFQLSFYIVNSDSGETPSCEHTNTEVLPGKDATCGESGLTEGSKCSDCGAVLTAQEEIPATGEHTYENGVCTGCGKEEPTGTQATITFDDVSKRTEYTTSIQVWVENGITVTNEKGASTSAVGDYYNPARFYKSSNVTIAYPGMTKIVIDCTGLDSKYVNGWLSVTGVTATLDNGIVTIVFDSPVDSFTYESMSAQSRAYSITVYAEASEPECQHTETKVEGALEATCVNNGYTGDTVCATCGELVTSGETIPATGEHTYVDGICTGCGAEKPSSGETTTSNATYIMSDYKVDGELGGGEFTRQLDDVVTFTISSGWFTSEARIYKNANGVLESKKPISSLVLNAGNKTSTFDVYVSEDGVNWTLYQEDVSYVSTYSDVTITFDTPVKYIKLDAPNAQLRIKTMTVTFVEEASEPVCQHTETKVEGALEATCVTDGYTGDTVCATCGELMTSGETIPATGEHSYVDGICTGCGEAEPYYIEATIVFDDFSKRTEYTNSIQVWKENGITVTNEKGASSTNVGDYCKPARFYSKSTLIIAYPGMTKLEVACNTATSRNTLVDTLEACLTNVTYSTNGNVVTIVFNEPVDSVTLVLASQVRVDSMTIYAVCQHTETKVEGALEATCTTDGYTGDTICVTCGETVIKGETIPATGHQNTVETPAVEPTKGEVGYTAGVYCNDCQTYISGHEEIPALGYDVYFIVPEGVNKVESGKCGPNGMTLPVAEAPEGYTFIGWSTCAVNNVTEKPTYLEANTTFTTNEDVVLYALYTYEEQSEGTTTSAYVKITTADEFTTGTYVMIVSNGYGPTVYSSSWLNAAKPTVSGDTVTNPNGVVWTLTVNGSTVTLKDANGQFVKPKSGNNNGIQTGSYNWNWTFSNGTFQFKGTGSDTTTLACNTQSSYKFRAYKNTTVTNASQYPSAFTLYKLTETTVPGESATYYTTVIGDTCAHENTELANVKAPTCATEGWTGDLVCSACNAVLVSGHAIPVVDHTAGEVVVENEVAPGCTTDGSYDNVVYCAVCGTELSRETIPVPATGHTAGEVVVENEVAPDCITDGSYDNVVYCAVCGTELSRETVTVPATGHTAGEVVVENEVAPDCITDGSYDNVVYCAVCGTELSRETVIVPATGHSHEAVVTEPTCTEEGFTTHTCACGDSYVDSFVPATGHTAGEVVVENEVAPGCTTEGSYDNVVYCAVCGEELSRETIVVPAVGHYYEETKVTKKPTCTKAGEAVYTCTRCGEKITEVLAPLGHEYEAVVTEPTCTEAGYTTYTCTVCGDSYVSDHVDALGHSYDAGVVTKEATCTEDGEKVYTCAVCGDTYTEVIEATGHSYEAVVTEPTCTEAGCTTYTCTVCGDTYTEEIPMVDHNIVDGVCTECGYSEYVVGDVNGDGKIDTTDAKLIMQYDLGMLDETDMNLAAMDVNGDGKVDTTDAKLIMQLDLGVITEFPNP